MKTYFYTDILFCLRRTNFSNNKSLNLCLFTIITFDSVEKSLSTGALDGIGVLYSKKTFITAGCECSRENLENWTSNTIQFLPCMRIFFISF